MRVVYTYSNQREGEKINAKRPRAHQRIVQRVRGIDFEMCYGESFEYSMSLKKSAHVVLEEVFSPFLHLSALEGALVGAMVLTKFDSYTKREVSRYLGAPEREWPFYYVTEKTLGKELERLRHEPEEVADWGRRGQEWMAKYHDPKRTLGKFLEFYGQ
ncbi:MAG: hypothetical protein JSW58_08235 [Candidatus Latescibacterota bacterium]|nr:MAG: hypothetical protein JSW58_08235 [Candidatus Latescibacterota bacterium]